MTKRIGPNKWSSADLRDPARENQRGDELSPADRRWIKLYMQYGNAIMASKKAYPEVSYNTQLKIAKKNKIKYNDVLDLLMEKAGLDDMTLINKLKEGLDATKIHGTNDDFVEIPDYNVRHKYLKTAKEWKDGKNNEGGTMNQMNIKEVKILVTRGDDES